MSPSLLATAATVMAAGVSRLTYRQADGRAAARPQLASESVTWFHGAYPIIQLLILVPALAAPLHHGGWLLRTHAQTPTSTAIGIVGMVVSIALFRSALRVLAENYSPCYAQKAPLELITEGPYRFVRHPIYTANLVLVASAWVAVGSAWVLIALVLLVAGYAASITVEEQALVRHFAGYREYRSRTGRLVPLLGRLRA